ncbi:MAG: cytochrome ubiquinol oxidase subunit I [Acidimicrobiales bacterium]
MTDLFAARQQMALSLGWHIVVACFGVGFPAVMLLAEWRGQRTGDPVYRALARRWSSALGVLFAVGAVSGTILSFEMGILWPGLMGRFGAVIGLPFALEALAFFIEAIFVGIYLYGWDRLAPRAHLLSGLPIVAAGVASAWFVVTANAWMNQPTGFRLEAGTVVDVDPVAAMLNPATPVQTTHMILAAFIVSGYLIAAVYAAALLRGRRDRYHQVGFLVPFAFASAFVAPQIVVGDWAARFLAERQPAKLAAAEGLYETQRGAPLHLGGIPIDGEVRYSIKIPKALSLLVGGSTDAEVIGLDRTAPADRPPVAVVHLAFQVMVAIGFLLLGLSAWFGWSWWRRRAPPRSRWFTRLAVAAGPLAVVALEAGWVVTEVGRQPWVVYELLRTEDAVTSAAGIRYGYYALIVVYAALTAGTVYALRRLAARPRPDLEAAPEAPALP